jgi:hypothetical protein
VSNTSIVGATMFDRMTGVDCATCARECAQRAHAFAYPCLAAVYDNDWNTCDMYAVDGTEANVTLVHYRTRTIIRLQQLTCCALLIISDRLKVLEMLPALPNI